jgi:hypothetical protein
MKKNLAPIVWFRFRGHGEVVWTVYLTARDISPEFEEFEQRTGDAASGFTLWERPEILIDAGSDTWDQEDTVLHEMCHVALRAAKISLFIEEEFISFLTPKLLPILRQEGLKIPKRPPGYLALARHARRVNGKP